MQAGGRETHLATGDEQGAPDGGGGSKAGRSHVVQDGQGAIHITSVRSHLDHRVVRDLAALLKRNNLPCGQWACFIRPH